MGEVIDITVNKPHTCGRAVCLHCKYVWVAVAPEGTFVFTCPKCELEKGVPQGLYCDSEGPYFVCNCGCDLFRISKNATLCVFCGVTATGF